MLTEEQILDHAKALNLIEDGDERDRTRNTLPISAEDRQRVQDKAIDLIATHTGIWFDTLMGELIMKGEQRSEMF